MHIVDSTVSSHAQLCTQLGIFAEYEKAINIRGNVGGLDKDESEHHLLGRYLNSAARTQYIACTEEDDATKLQEELLAQLLGGKLYIIDIAAGNGAGTLSLINSICKLRLVEEKLPLEALDVEIHALDISTYSLEYYQQIALSLVGQYLEAAIELKIVTHIVDLTKDAEVEKKIRQIKDQIGENPRYLLICSAISGVTQEIFKTKFYRSYQYIAKSFQQLNSTFFWVEPRTKNGWMLTLWLAFFSMFRANPRSTDTVGLRKTYCWVDPHTNATLDTAADFFLVGLAP